MTSPLSANTPRSKEMVKMFRRKNGKLYLEYEAYGKRVQKSTRRMDTKENRAFIQAEVIPILEKKIINGDFSSEKPKNFKHYADIFSSFKETEKIKTYDQLQEIVKILIERFGDKRIDNINRGMIKEFVQERLQVNMPKTVHNYLTPLRGIFDTAIDYKVIKENPCSGIKLPKHVKKDFEPFSNEQVEIILKNSKGWLKLFLAISFYTGMRTGEVLVLKYSDIDFENKVIHIKRSINKGNLTTPKTEKSIRDVPLFDELIKYIPKQTEDSSQWIFPKKDGSYYSSFPSHKQKEWRKLLNTCNIPYRKIYTTRHTFIVSMLKSSNLGIVEVAQLAGHVNTKMIIENYAKYIKNEHLKVNRKISLFTDKSVTVIS